MLAAFALIIGVFLGATVYLLIGRRLPARVDWVRTPTGLGWWTLGMGTIAGVTFVLGGGAIPGPWTDTVLTLLVSIVTAFASVITGVGAVRRNDRRWPTWVGLVFGGVPAVMWIYITVALLGTGA